MPRGRSAASFARERLQTGTDVTPKERVALLKIISMDDRQKKQLQRAKLMLALPIVTRKSPRLPKSITEMIPRKKRSVFSGRKA